MVNLLATVGEKERALELATFVIRHPATWQWSKDTIASLIAELKAKLSPNAVKAVQARASEKKLEEVFEELRKMVV